MTVTATKVRDLPTTPAGASQRLYRLSEPISFDDGESTRTTQYVVTSAVVAYGGPETYIFPADESDDVLDWGELPGSYRGGLDHDEAIRRAGWTLVSGAPACPS